MAKQSAHPMLEPLDYECDHDEAERRFTGELLELYKLLWSAGVATVCEGPVTRDHTLEARRQNNGVGHPIAAAYGREMVERGWKALLEHEPLPDEGVLPDHGNVTRFLESSVPPARLAVVSQKGVLKGEGVGESLQPSSAWTVEVVDTSPPLLDDAGLIAEMAAKGVGRPSTYARGFQQALKHGLVARDGSTGRRLEVGQRGSELANAMGGLPEQRRIGWRLSSELEAALQGIEDDPATAGAVLNDFCRRFFGQDCGLASWLDALEIEGESLTAAMERHLRALPPATSWEGVVLPLGLVPSMLAKNHLKAVEARRELDGLIAGPDPQAWRRRSVRNRASVRLAALAAARANSEDEWIARSARDIVVRWWIDLGPEETPLTREELQQGLAAVGDRGELQKLAEAAMAYL